MSRSKPMRRAGSAALLLSALLVSTALVSPLQAADEAGANGTKIIRVRCSKISMMPI